MEEFKEYDETQNNSPEEPAAAQPGNSREEPVDHSANIMVWGGLAVAVVMNVFALFFGTFGIILLLFTVYVGMKYRKIPQLRRRAITVLILSVTAVLIQAVQLAIYYW